MGVKVLAATLGYDAIVEVAIVLLGVGIGFSTGILAPTTAVTQDIAETDCLLVSGCGLSALGSFYIVTAIYIIRYGQKCKQNPAKAYYTVWKASRRLRRRRPL